jgi:hypothetical protein
MPQRLDAAADRPSQSPEQQLRGVAGGGGTDADEQQQVIGAADRVQEAGAARTATTAGRLPLGLPGTRAKARKDGRVDAARVADGAIEVSRY